MNSTDIHNMKYVLRGGFNLLWTFSVCVGIVLVSKITGKRIFG